MNQERHKKKTHIRLSSTVFSLSSVLSSSLSLSLCALSTSLLTASAAVVFLLKDDDDEEEEEIDEDKDGSLKNNNIQK